jgi:phage tail-like protein
MPVIGTPRSFHKRFKFKVQIEGFGEAAFSTCSEIKSTAAVVEYREGGRLISHKSPGLLTFDNVTLEEGATSSRAMYDWFRSVADAAASTGLIDNNYKRPVDVLQLDRDNSVLKRWRLFGAWPTVFQAGAWDATSNETVIQSIEMAYDHFELA